MRSTTFSEELAVDDTWSVLVASVHQAMSEVLSTDYIAQS